MTTHTKANSNNKLKNVERTALIKYRMAIKGFTVKDIVADLSLYKPITANAVYRSILGLSKISRVDAWLENKEVI